MGRNAQWRHPADAGLFLQARRPMSGAKTMRAVAYRKSLPITDAASLEDIELPVPTPGPYDLLVRIEAVSVNPVDAKVRVAVDPGGEPKVLGFDAAGVVTAI